MENQSAAGVETGTVKTAGAGAEGGTSANAVAVDGGNAIASKEGVEGAGAAAVIGGQGETRDGSPDAGRGGESDGSSGEGSCSSGAPEVSDAASALLNLTAKSKAKKGKSKTRKRKRRVSDTSEGEQLMQCREKVAKKESECLAIPREGASAETSKEASATAAESCAARVVPEVETNTVPLSAEKEAEPLPVPREGGSADTSKQASAASAEACATRVVPRVETNAVPVPASGSRADRNVEAEAASSGEASRLVSNMREQSSRADEERSKTDSRASALTDSRPIAADSGANETSLAVPRDSAVGSSSAPTPENSRGVGSAAAHLEKPTVEASKGAIMCAQNTALSPPGSAKSPTTAIGTAERAIGAAEPEGDKSSLGTGESTRPPANTVHPPGTSVAPHPPGGQVSTTLPVVASVQGVAPPVQTTAQQATPQQTSTTVPVAAPRTATHPCLHSAQTTRPSQSFSEGQTASNVPCAVPVVARPSAPRTRPLPGAGTAVALPGSQVAIQVQTEVVGHAAPGASPAEAPASSSTHALSASVLTATCVRSEFGAPPEGHALVLEGASAAPGDVVRKSSAQHIPVQASSKVSEPQHRPLVPLRPRPLGFIGNLPVFPPHIMPTTEEVPPVPPVEDRVAENVRRVAEKLVSVIEPMQMNTLLENEELEVYRAHVKSCMEREPSATKKRMKVFTGRASVERKEFGTALRRALIELLLAEIQAKTTVQTEDIVIISSRIRAHAEKVAEEKKQSAMAAPVKSGASDNGHCTATPVGQSSGMSNECTIPLAPKTGSSGEEAKCIPEGGGTFDAGVVDGSISADAAALQKAKGNAERAKKNRGSAAWRSALRKELYEGYKRELKAALELRASACNTRAKAGSMGASGCAHIAILPTPRTGRGGATAEVPQGHVLVGSTPPPAHAHPQVQGTPECQVKGVSQSNDLPRASLHASPCATAPNSAPPPASCRAQSQSFVRTQSPPGEPARPSSLLNRETQILGAQTSGAQRAIHAAESVHVSATAQSPVVSGAAPRPSTAAAQPRRVSETESMRHGRDHADNLCQRQSEREGAAGKHSGEGPSTAQPQATTETDLNRQSRTQRQESVQGREGTSSEPSPGSQKQAQQITCGTMSEKQQENLSRQPSSRPVSTSLSSS